MSHPYPPQPYPPQPYGPPPVFLRGDRNGIGTSALVLGIIALLLSVVPVVGVIAWILAPLGLVLGFVGLSRAENRQATNRGSAITGLVLSAIALVVCVAWVVVFAGVAASSTTAPSGPAAVRSAPAPITPALARPVVPEPAPAGPPVIGDGTWVVGVDIEPGTYRSTGASPGLFDLCYWSTKNGPSTNSDIIDLGTGNEGDRQVVEIGGSVKAFVTDGCAPWEKVS